MRGGERAMEGRRESDGEEEMGTREGDDEKRRR